jgi:hypothetical protein
MTMAPHSTTARFYERVGKSSSNGKCGSVRPNAEDFAVALYERGALKS